MGCVCVSHVGGQIQFRVVLSWQDRASNACQGETLRDIMQIPRCDSSKTMFVVVSVMYRRFSLGSLLGAAVPAYVPIIHDQIRVGYILPGNRNDATCMYEASMASGRKFVKNFEPIATGNLGTT